MENLVAFRQATVKLNTVQCDASIEHVSISINFILRRKSGFRIRCRKYDLGSFVFLNFASLVNVDVCQIT